MTKTNAANERIKYDYFKFLREAHGRDEATIDRVAKSLARFEVSTRGRDFKRFHREQAVAFKVKLGEALNVRTGERLSKSTALATMRDLRAFFLWLAREPGFKSAISYSDAEYFNLPEKDVAVANARRESPVPTLAQVRHVLEVMPIKTVLERRDRALIAFTMISGARVSALASLRRGHVDIAGGFVEQDARTVRTKGSKTFRTYFMPVDDKALSIVTDWIEELDNVLRWGPNDPLFPATDIGIAKDGGFETTGIERKCWASSGPVREIFRRAFTVAGLPYFNPHSFRSMLVRHAMYQNLTTEEIVSWSQNLGHSEVMTTIFSYGKVPLHKQGELIRASARTPDSKERLTPEQIEALEAVIRSAKAGTIANSPTTGSGG